MNKNSGGLWRLASLWLDPGAPNEEVKNIIELILLYFHLIFADQTYSQW